jgi:hypothetical protein
MIFFTLYISKLIPEREVVSRIFKNKKITVEKIQVAGFINALLVNQLVTAGAGGPRRAQDAGAPDSNGIEPLVNSNRPLVTEPTYQ